MKRLIILLVILVNNSLCGQPRQAENSSAESIVIIEVIQKLENTLQQEAMKDSTGSISCAVIIGDKVIWQKGFGPVDSAGTATASSATLYMIGSISKSVTAVALARLVDQKVLAWDDPVERYLPEINGLKNWLADWPSITIRQLASHTAGLDREPELPGANKGPLEEWESKLLQALPTTAMVARPGEKFYYSNIGYGILGLAMCRAAGKPFDALLQEQVFTPLRMDNTALVLSPEQQKYLASSYTGTRPYENGRGYKFPNGGVFSTTADMARLIMAILNTGFPGYLSEAARKELFSIQAVDYDNEKEASGYGLGFNIYTDKKAHHLVFHGGIVAPGYSASVFCDLQIKTGIIVLRNDPGHGDIMQLATNLSGL